MGTGALDEKVVEENVFNFVPKNLLGKNLSLQKSGQNLKIK